MKRYTSALFLLPCLVTPAMAEVTATAAPVIAGNVPAAIEAEQKVRTPIAIPRYVPGPWTRQTHLDPTVSHNLLVAPAGTLPVATRLPAGATQLTANQRKVALRINDGLSHIGHDVAPALADDADLDHLDILESETLWESVGDCNTYRLTLRNVWIELPWGVNALDGDFRTGDEVVADLDLPTAEAHAELRFRIINTSSSDWCAFDMIPAMDIEAEFSVSDLAGSLSASLDVAGDTVQIDEVDDLEFALADFDWDTNSWFLDTIISLGFGLYDLFDFTCSGQADCLTEAVNLYALGNEAFVDAMLTQVNDTIDAPLTLNTGTSSDGFSVSFDVGLADIKSSTTHNTLTSTWDVALSSTAAADPCASALTMQGYILEGNTGDAQLTSDDLELEVPFSKLAHVAYLAGKQGLFCQSGITRLLSEFSVTPNGAVSVGGPEAGDAANTVVFTLPVKATSTSPAASGTVTGTLKVKGEVSVDGGSDLVVTGLSADVSALAGSLTISGITLPAAALETAIDAAVADVLTDMGDLELMNAVVATGIPGVGVAVDHVTTDGKAFVFGLDFE